MDYKQFPEIIVYGPVERTLRHSALYRYLKKKVLRLARDLGWIDPDLTEEWRLGEAILKELVREIREIGAQRILRKQPAMPGLKALEPLRSVVGKARVQLEIPG